MRDNMETEGRATALAMAWQWYRLGQEFFNISAACAHKVQGLGMFQVHLRHHVPVGFRKVLKCTEIFICPKIAIVSRRFTAFSIVRGAVMPLDH